MGKKFPKHVNIIAARDPSKPDGVHFHMERPNGAELESIVFDKKGEGMGKQDDHELKFKLIQESGMTLEFAQDLKDVLWVAWGDKDHEPSCPMAPPANWPDPVFFAETSAPKRLTVVNKNPDNRFFAFTINFTDKAATGPKKLISYDPIGENKNGGSTKNPGFNASMNTTVTVVACVAIALVIGYVLLT